MFQSAGSREPDLAQFTDLAGLTAFQSAGSREPDCSTEEPEKPVHLFQSAGSREPDRGPSAVLRDRFCFNPQARESLIN